ncbi:MAG: hypothetical protein ACRC7O_01700, partial [Fimbriiglobus sp.]
VAAVTVLGYSTPPGRPADSADPLPTRLALLATPAAGRVLVHVAPAEGKFFGHALLHVPATADAQDAILTWGSQLWQKTDPDGAGGDLPDMPYLPVADGIDDAAVKAWLSTPVRRELLEFVLTALLGTPGHTRIVVAAPAAEMALVVYAVTRVLPSGMLDDFTFSTYEPDPLGCTARLMGYDGGAADWDLPAQMYSDSGLGFNSFTGKRSDLPHAVPFAAFATAALAAGDFAGVDDVKATWQRLGMSGARQFDLVFRLARGTGVLTKEETAEALQYPPLTSWVAARQDALNQFLEWALDDRAFATASFGRVVQALRQKQDVLGKLGQTVRDHGQKALKDGDRARTANALEVILPMIAPAKANAVWGELLGQLTDPAAVSWDMRWYLLPRFVRFKQQNPAGPAGTDAAITKWVEVPSEKLGELLALDIPKSYHLAAARACLARDGEPTADLARTLAGFPSLTLTLLQSADAKAATVGQEKLFDHLLAESPNHPWFEELLEASGNYPPALLNKFFEASLAAGKVDADRVVRLQGPKLLDVFAGQSGLDKVGMLFLAAPPMDLLRDARLLEFLGRLKIEPKATDELKTRVSAVQAVRDYLDDPTLDPDAMAAAAAGLGVTPPAVPAAAKAEVFTAVANGLLKRAGSGTLQTDLEAVLTKFGSVLANDPADLYENLLRDLRGRTDLARDPNLVFTFLAVALGATKSDALAGKLDGLDGHAFAVASDAAKAGGAKFLDDIDARTTDWPKSAKVQWGFLRAAVEPAGSRLGRDVLLFVAGAVVASAAWAAVTFLG